MGRYGQRLSTFAASWRSLALRGLVAVPFDLAVISWPGHVLALLAPRNRRAQSTPRDTIALRRGDWRLLAGSGTLSVLFGVLLACLPRRSDLREIIEVEGEGTEIGAA